jgi:HD-GYP domain-containing protein (c-di-GMP phosphodiesterase class II)
MLNSISDKTNEQERLIRKFSIDAISTKFFRVCNEIEQHEIRVCAICKRIGELMNLNDEEMENLKLLALIHDIGKVAIDEKILLKEDVLSSSEWDEMKKHPETGFYLTKSIPELKNISKYILYHHERWDGTGYPFGLSGASIPLLSRIVAVADAYDAMTNDRPYRKALSKSIAREELRRNSALQFDPKIVKLFLEEIE